MPTSLANIEPSCLPNDTLLGDDLALHYVACAFPGAVGGGGA